jgi:hypothetical protein
MGQPMAQVSVICTTADASDPANAAADSDGHDRLAASGTSSGVQSENDVRQRGSLSRVDHDKVQETRTTADISDPANTAPGTAFRNGIPGVMRWQLTYGGRLLRLSIN